MNTNFENINLYIRERYKLFCLRWIKKQVTETYFGKETTRKLTALHFLEARYEFSDTTKTKVMKSTFYELTDTYFRYCVWRRNRFFYGTLWPQLVAGITSLIVSVLTVVVLMSLGLR